MKAAKFVLLILFYFTSMTATSQDNKILKFRAKEITMKTSTTKYGAASVVDFLVAVDFKSSRFTFFRDKK